MTDRVGVLRSADGPRRGGRPPGGDGEHGHRARRPGRVGGHQPADDQHRHEPGRRAGARRRAARTGATTSPSATTSTSPVTSTPAWSTARSPWSSRPAPQTDPSMVVAHDDRRSTSLPGRPCVDEIADAGLDPLDVYAHVVAALARGPARRRRRHQRGDHPRRRAARSPTSARATRASSRGSAWPRWCCTRSWAAT